MDVYEKHEAKTFPYFASSRLYVNVIHRAKSEENFQYLLCAISFQEVGEEEGCGPN